MADFGSRRGEANLGLPLMLLTFLLIGGFMYWLYATAEPTQPAVVEVVEEEPADPMAGVAVDPDDLKTDAINGFVGQVVHLDGVAVSNLMGQAFFVDLPATEALPTTPFLARLAPDVADVGALAVGDMTNVGGMLLAMTDSIVNDWEASGAISGGDRILVEFATHFIEVAELEIIGGEEAPAGS